MEGLIRMKHEVKCDDGTFETVYEHEKIRYLGWKQPYAQLMLSPFFKKETRTWDTKYRGLVLITASKFGFHKNQLFEIAGQEQFYRINICLRNFIFHYGMAIAVARLCDSKPMRKEDEDDCFVKFNPKLFVHTYQDLREIKPFEIKGSQGWRKLDQQTIDKIKFI